jgi:TatD DNase family protein
LFAKYLPEARFVGEIGLDASPAHFASYARQKEVFETILSMCGKQGGKILSVHSVRSTKDVLRSIEKHLPDGSSKVVLHWFNGTASEIRWAIEMGCYFSVNAQMLNNPKRMKTLLTLPLDRVLTETDGPFTVTSGHPSRPKDAFTAVCLLAKLYAIDENELGKIALSNLDGLESTS